MNAPIDRIGVELLRWLHENRESVPGKGRSAREQLLDVVFCNNTDYEAIQDIAEEVSILCKQVLEENA